MRTSLNRERRSEDRLTDQEDEKEEEVVVMDVDLVGEEATVTEVVEGNCRLSEVVCSFKELEARLEG